MCLTERLLCCDQSAEALRRELEAQTQDLESLREEMAAAEARRTQELEETIARYNQPMAQQKDSAKSQCRAWVVSGCTNRSRKVFKGTLSAWHVVAALRFFIGA